MSTWAGEQAGGPVGWSRGADRHGYGSSGRWKSSSGLGIAVALGAALRSTWSPCGQSMLSQITPLTERGRHHHFGVTAGWFVVGSVLGGATLGLVAALGAAATSAAEMSSDTALAILAVLALGLLRSRRGRRRRGVRVPPAVLPSPGQRRLVAALPGLALRRGLRLASRRRRSPPTS